MWAVSQRNCWRKTSARTISQASPEQITSIHGIGNEIAQAIGEWFRQNQELIPELRKLGFKLETTLPQNSLAGKTFVITGTLPTLSRADAKAKIQAQGGKVTETVSKNTNYLVVGENPGSKLEKAQKLGITILNESQLLELCSNLQRTDNEAPV